MSNNHLITRNIGNLRGFSTDSIYLRPPNVADIAQNIQKAPDGTMQARRGYQCQIKVTGGMGLGTFDDPVLDKIQTVTLSTDGFLYNKLEKQLYLHYNSAQQGYISAITQANPGVVTTIAPHGLVTGAQVQINSVVGMFQVNNTTFTITVIDANNFSIGVDTSAFGAYVSGGLWTIVQNISGITQANPGVVTTASAHGLTTGTQIVMRNVAGMTQVNGVIYTITVTGANTFSIGVDTTSFGAYVSGGTWVISAYEQRFLGISIYVDPAQIYSTINQSINFQVVGNYAARISGNQTSVNTINVVMGHNIQVSQVVQFYNSLGVLQTRNVVGVGATTIDVDGAAVSVTDGSYVNQLFNYVFGKGYDVTAPYLISQFLNSITDPISGVQGLTYAINGDVTLPAAFFQILESAIIVNGGQYTINYWYWQKINTISNTTGGVIVPMPGSADTKWQNSPLFENASMAVYDDVIYVANGWDFPQKYDGQTFYRAGMPAGVRPRETENNTFMSKPFQSTEKYEYASTYSFIDNRGHFIEGVLSEVDPYTVANNNTATNVALTNLDPAIGSNWNTNGALATGAATTIYGPDVNGWYYNKVPVTAGNSFTLKIGDTAYFANTIAAQIDPAAGTQTNVITITVLAGHSIVPGDTIYFLDTSNKLRMRLVVSVTATTITIQGANVTVDGSIGANNENILTFETGKVFGNVAIVNGAQNNVNSIAVKNNYPGASAHTIQVNDIVEFVDAHGDLQRRTAIAPTNATTVTVTGIPVDVNDLSLISSTNQRTDAITIQRAPAVQLPLGSAYTLSAATLSNGAAGNVTNAISNNLRINVYRTKKNTSLGTNGSVYRLAAIPNKSDGTATSTYIDGIPDEELTFAYEIPNRPPNPPPVCKYLRAFNTQMFYAGGKRDVAEDSDRVFFSQADAPEVVPLPKNLFNVPNVDDDVTGIGVSGSTLVVTKNHSIWAATGNFLSGQIDVVQIAPGTNIGCAAHASIASVGTLMYFLHTNGVYALTENQIYPTDNFGNPIAISLAIENIFRESNFLPQYQYVLKRAVGINYTKDNIYLLFLPCENAQTTIRDANENSILLAYDYQYKNWFTWTNMNAAGGMAVIDDDLYFQERRFSTIDGNSANLYKQHRFYRLIDHADHAGAEYIEWRSSWEDLGQPEVRKKFSRCILLMDRLSEILQFNNPVITFSSYLNRIPNLQNTIADLSQVDNIRNATWSTAGWGFNYWSGYQDSFVAVNLKQGTVAKSIQVGFTIKGINYDIRLAGYQLEAIPENRMTAVR